MTQTSKERKQATRLAFCIANLALYDDCGRYAVVPSASNPSAKPYIVGIDEQTLYATSCSCDGSKKYGRDCLHALATDRALDGERDMRRRAAPLVAQAVESVAETAAIGNIEHAYEVLAPTKKVTRSCESCGGNHATSTCWL